MKTYRVSTLICEVTGEDVDTADFEDRSRWILQSFDTYEEAQAFQAAIIKCTTGRTPVEIGELMKGGGK